jgi:[ribosomal protein S18]-alanine N-acetyltransferase
MPPEPTVRTITDADEAGRLALDGLSEYFGPYLRYFVSETLRCGGEVDVATEAGDVTGLLVGNEPERLGSVFARTDEALRSLGARHDRWSLFAERRPDPPIEPYVVYRGRPTATASPLRLTHPIRPARPADLDGMRALLDRVDGPVNPRWFEGLPWESERGFVAEDGGRTVGEGWLSVVGSRGRLHSLAVEPRYRRLGLATDLVGTRVELARSLGLTEVISEIEQDNRASRLIAERFGMRPVGRMFLRSAPAPTPVATSAGLRTPGTPWPSSR